MGWDEEFEKLLVQVEEQLGPEARAVVSVFGRLKQEKTPEVAERIEQKVVDQARSSRRGPGGKRKAEGEHSREQVRRFHAEHGHDINATMKAFPKLSLETIGKYIGPKKPPKSG
jgi:hypothetical protein